MDLYNQETRFKEQVGQILKGTKTSVNITADGTVKEAKINTNEALTDTQLIALMHLKESWWFKNMSLKRSGAGIRIQYATVIKSS